MIYEKQIRTSSSSKLPTAKMFSFQPKCLDLVLPVVSSIILWSYHK